MQLARSRPIGRWHRNVGVGRNARAFSAPHVWVLLFAAVVVAVAANDAAAADEMVIPPGQEELIAGMLGRGETLLAQCTLAAGQVQYSTIKATYACPGGEVSFELRSPDDGPASATRTARFAIILTGGSPPPGLVDALAARIRSRETAFEWQALRPRQFAVSWALIEGVGIIGLAIVGWVLAGRSSDRPSGSPQGSQ